ncbi:hypothetical protein LXL04_005431 [Taraxacum kok-saghyz]
MSSNFVTQSLSISRISFFICWAQSKKDTQKKNPFDYYHTPGFRFPSISSSKRLSYSLSAFQLQTHIFRETSYITIEFQMDHSDCREQDVCFDLESGTIDIHSNNEIILDPTLDEKPAKPNSIGKKVKKEKCKKGISAKKPPRPPRGFSLDVYDQNIIKELAELAIIRRARIERMKVLKQKQVSKLSSSSSSHASLFAMLFTIIFFIVIFLQGRNSGVTFQGSPQMAQTNENGLIFTQGNTPYVEDRKPSITKLELRTDTARKTKRQNWYDPKMAAKVTLIRNIFIDRLLRLGGVEVLKPRQTPSPNLMNASPTTPSSLAVAFAVAKGVRFAENSARSLNTMLTTFNAYGTSL